MVEQERAVHIIRQKLHEKEIHPMPSYIDPHELFLGGPSLRCCRGMKLRRIVDVRDAGVLAM